MDNEAIARWMGSVDQKLTSIGNDAATAAGRMNNHADRIASLERTRHGLYVLVIPFQVVFGAIVAYASRKLGA